MISDGGAAGSHSTPEDLVAAVRQIEHGASDVTLVGIGLGPGTDHVSHYYANATACVPPEDLATEIGGLLQRALARSGPGGAR